LLLFALSLPVRYMKLSDEFGVVLLTVVGFASAGSIIPKEKSPERK